MKSALIKENKNFYWDDKGFICHFSGKPVGEPHCRFSEYSEEDLDEAVREDLKKRNAFIIHHEKNIQVTPHGVLVEYDSNRFDIENECEEYNRDEYYDYIITEDAQNERHQRRHYINKMFYNNNNELVFGQYDYLKCATLIGDELVHLCDSTVTLTDDGIAVARRNIAKDFPEMLNSIGDFDGSGEKIKIDNSGNEKAEEFFTYEQLNENYKKKEAERAAHLKQRQEDHDWTERHSERLYKFGFNNITLKTQPGKTAYRAYKAWRNVIKTQAREREQIRTYTQEQEQTPNIF